DGRALGTVTDRDLVLRVLAEGQMADVKIERVMTREAIACSPDDDILRAQELMAEHHKSRILCVDQDGTVVGVISLSDIAQHEGDAQAAQTLRAISEREAQTQVH